jgi:ribosome-associated protein
MIPVTDTLSLDERDFEERFVRSSGPGGQNVNKVATAVQLRLDVRASSLPDAIKERLALVAGSRMTDDGVLVIDAREYRTQPQNREAARERLVALIKRAASPAKKRRPTRPGKAAKEQRLSSKKRRGAIKARRRESSGADE